MLISEQRKLKYGDMVHVLDPSSGWDEIGQVISTDIRGIEIHFQYRPSVLHNIRHIYRYWMFGNALLNVATKATEMRDL